jgi:hypothetical protein
MDQNKIASMIAEIEQGGLGRDLGMATKTLISMVASAIPLIGGAAAIAIEKSANQLLEIDTEKHLVTIARGLLTMMPKIDEIDVLSEQIDLISKALATNSSIAGELRKLIDFAIKLASNAHLIDEHVVNNNGGIVAYSSVAMENLRLSSTATNGATTTFDGLTHSGSSKFDTDRSIQKVSNSRFSGRGPWFSSFVEIQNGAFGQGTVETNVSEPGRNIAFRVTRVSY